MATSKFITFSFICFTIYQTSITNDPRSQHPSSTSKMAGCRLFCLMKIYVNKQELATIQETQGRNYDITKFLLLSDTHSKYVTAKENFEAFLRALVVHIVKDTTI